MPTKSWFEDDRTTSSLENDLHWAIAWKLVCESRNSFAFALLRFQAKKPAMRRQHRQSFVLYLLRKPDQTPWSAACFADAHPLI